MECHICEVRSSIGYCVQCHGLLCETCGVPCDQCRKISCGTHTHATKSGKVLCESCFAERRAKRDAVKAEIVSRGAGDTSFTGLETQPAASGEIRNEALVESARKIVEPWQMSLYIALLGIGLGIVLLLFPTMRHVAFGETTISTGYVLLIFTVLGGIWAWIGLRNEEYFKDRIKCFYGIGASGVCFILAALLIASAPTVKERPVVTTIDVRTGAESTEELQNWRQDALRKYQPGTTPPTR